MAHYILGIKQRSTHEDWLAVLANIPEYVSREEVERKVTQAAERIRSTIRGKASAFCWSGGKDSQAIRFIMEQNAISYEGLLAMCNLEYPEFLRWATDNMPLGLEIINTGQDLEWLAANPPYLFPDQVYAPKWFAMVQHTAQRQYSLKHGNPILILGRRHAEGNHCGPNGLYTTKEGVTRFSPIFDWKHEDVLALTYYFGLPLAPFYRWPRGFRVGSGSWPARQWCASIQQGWQEIWEIDPSIVREAAPFFGSARNFLECAGYSVS